MSIEHKKYAKRSRKLSRNQLYGIAVAALIVISLLAVYSFHNQPTNEFKAATIDQLSSLQEYTNVTFVKTANKTLIGAGYQVNYYKGSDVTVDFYRGLADDGYKILIFRVHSALQNGNQTPLSLFTSELYSSSKYAIDQSARAPARLDIAMYSVGGTQYFGIMPGFIEEYESFQNATVILMGCNGLDGQLRSLSMLQAFVDRGAKVVIGWNASVSESHTDNATQRLLYHLLVQNETIKDAVNSTNNEIGPDLLAPNGPDELTYYPSEDSPFNCAVDVGNYRIPHGPMSSAAARMGSNYVFASAIVGISALPLSLSVEVICAFGKFRRKTFSVFRSALKL